MDYSDTTVLIPVKDEPAVGKVTREVLAKIDNCKIIVIHKGELGVKLPQNRRITVLAQKSSGKGRACVEAAKHVKTDILCFIDGDDTYRVEDLKKVISMVRNGSDLAIGNRFHNIDERAMPHYVILGNNVLTGTLNALYGTRIKDSQTGLRAIRKGVFDAIGITETHFGIEEEMIIKVKRRRLRISETPIDYRERVGTSKQFKPVDGVKLFLIIFKFVLA